MTLREYFLLKFSEQSRTCMKRSILSSVCDNSDPRAPTTHFWCRKQEYPTELQDSEDHGRKWNLHAPKSRVLKKELGFELFLTMYNYPENLS